MWVTAAVIMGLQERAGGCTPPTLCKALAGSGAQCGASAWTLEAAPGGTNELRCAGRGMLGKVPGMSSRRLCTSTRLVYTMWLVVGL